MFKKKPKSDIIYLALPYMHENKFIMEFRAMVSDVICADLMNQGKRVYAPISSCHHIAVKYGLPRDWEFWKKMDEEFIKVCGKVLVITLKGWEESVGVNAEMKLAKKYGIPIEFIDPEPYISLGKLSDAQKSCETTTDGNLLPPTPYLKVKKNLK